MDLKKRIINNHLSFRRITQEGGYYMNSVINQSVLTDLPNFYNEFEEKINKLINQLNANGKKVSGLLTVVELLELNGRSKLKFPVESILSI